MDLGFLDDIKIDDHKEKSIRFGKDDIHLLKFVEYKGRKFSPYVKELIRKDLEEYTANRLSEREVEKIAKRVYRNEKEGR